MSPSESKRNGSLLGELVNFLPFGKFDSKQSPSSIESVHSKKMMQTFLLEKSTSLYYFKF